jgi:hypothetical protein
LAGCQVGLLGATGTCPIDDDPTANWSVPSLWLTTNGSGEKGEVGPPLTPVTHTTGNEDFRSDAQGHAAPGWFGSLTWHSHSAFRCTPVETGNGRSTRNGHERHASGSPLPTQGAASARLGSLKRQAMHGRSAVVGREHHHCSRPMRSTQRPEAHPTRLRNHRTPIAAARASDSPGLGGVRRGRPRHQ